MSDESYVSGLLTGFFFLRPGEKHDDHLFSNLFKNKILLAHCIQQPTLTQAISLLLRCSLEEPGSQPPFHSLAQPPPVLYTRPQPAVLLRMHVERRVTKSSAAAVARGTSASSLCLILFRRVGASRFFGLHCGKCDGSARWLQRMLYVATRKSMAGFLDHEHLSTRWVARRRGAGERNSEAARLQLLHARACMQSWSRTNARRISRLRHATVPCGSSTQAAELFALATQKVHHGAPPPIMGRLAFRAPIHRPDKDDSAPAMARFPQQRGLVSALAVGLAMATRVGAFR